MILKNLSLLSFACLGKSDDCYNSSDSETEINSASDVTKANCESSNANCKYKKAYVVF